MPTDCAKLIAERPLPAVKKGQNAYVSAVMHRAAAAEREDEKTAARECIVDVSGQFGAAK